MKIEMKTRDIEIRSEFYLLLREQIDKLCDELDEIDSRIEESESNYYLASRKTAMEFLIAEIGKVRFPELNFGSLILEPKCHE